MPEHEIPKNNTLYIGNLFFETSEADLMAFFETFGPVESVKIIYDHRGLSKGYAGISPSTNLLSLCTAANVANRFGYVVFEDQENADRAVEFRNQEVFQGRRLTVQYHRKRDPSAERPSRRANAPSKTLFIGNMSYEMSDKDLNDLFREVRNVLDVRVAIDRRSGQPRGFAHADFIDIPSATKAMQLLTDKEIYGRRLRIDYSATASHSGAR